MKPIFASEDWLGALKVFLGVLGGAGFWAGLQKAFKTYEQYLKTRDRKAEQTSEATTKRMAALREAEERRERVAMDEWKELAAKLNQTIRRQARAEEECRQREMRYQRIIVHQSGSLERLCDLATYLHGVACRQNEVMRQNGMAAEHVQPLEDLLPKITPLSELLPDETEMEEKRRNLAQATELVTGEAFKMTGETGKP